MKYEQLQIVVPIDIHVHCSTTIHIIFQTKASHYLQAYLSYNKCDRLASQFLGWSTLMLFKTVNVSAVHIAFKEFLL